MADIADMAQELIDAEAAARAKRSPYTLPTGTPGECETCGDFSPRLVRGDCPRCREKIETRAFIEQANLRLGGDRELPTPLLPEADELEGDEKLDEIEE